MYMAIIPSYKVTFTVEMDDKSAKWEWNISSDNLDSFCRILRENGCEHYKVVKQEW